MNIKYYIKLFVMAAVMFFIIKITILSFTNVVVPYLALWLTFLVIIVCGILASATTYIEDKFKL